MITGGVVSWTVKVVTHVDALFDASVAVIVTACGPIPTSEPAAGDCVSVTALQLSVAATPERKLGTADMHEAFAEPTWLGAQLVIVGGVVSTTVKDVVHVETLLDASVTVTVTLWKPRPNSVPAAGSCVFVTLLQLSLAIVAAAKFGVAPKHEAFADTSCVGAHVAITGGVVSTTVKSVVHVVLLFEPSVTVTVTLCGPNPNDVPVGGDCVFVIAPQLSLATVPSVKSGSSA